MSYWSRGRSRSRSSYYSEWRPYVSVGSRMADADRVIAARKKKGLPADPVTVEGREIAETFWGQAWCDHMESFSDYENRLPRGRNYVRNGLVAHLEIGPGVVSAVVVGSDTYTVAAKIKPLPAVSWKRIVSECSGKIDSVVELLEGTLSKGILQILSRRDGGLLPTPREMTFECSCPDWASMCKHVAATLYGVGARLDRSPDLLFRMRQVDQSELVTGEKSVAELVRLGTPARERVLATTDLAGVFGIDLEPEAAGRTPKRAAKSVSERLGEAKRVEVKQIAAKGNATPRVSTRPISPPPAPTPRIAPAQVARSRSGKQIPVRHRADTTRPVAAKAKLQRNLTVALPGGAGLFFLPAGAQVLSAPSAHAHEGGGGQGHRHVTTRSLLDLGIPRSRFQNWVSAGYLGKTPVRGRYVVTPHAAALIANARSR